MTSRFMAAASPISITKSTYRVASEDSQHEFAEQTYSRAFRICKPYPSAEKCPNHLKQFLQSPNDVACHVWTLIARSRRAFRPQSVKLWKTVRAESKTAGAQRPRDRKQQPTELRREHWVYHFRARPSVLSHLSRTSVPKNISPSWPGIPKQVVSAKSCQAAIA